MTYHKFKKGILVWILVSVISGQEAGFQIITDTLCTIKIGSGKNCIQYNIEYDDWFPVDFNIDDSLNIYLIEDGNQTLKKFGKNAFLFWKIKTGDIDFQYVHFFNGKIFLGFKNILFVVDPKTGNILSKDTLGIEADRIALVNGNYFYKQYLYIGCNISMWSSSVFLVDLVKKTILDSTIGATSSGSGDKKRYWMMPDCQECLEYVSNLRPSGLLGQSSKYMLVMPMETRDEKDYKTVLVFNKQSKIIYKTEIGKMFCQPLDKRAYKFINDRTAYCQAAEYKDGMPFRAHYVKVEFP